MKHKAKTSITHIQAAIVGYVRMGLSIQEIVKLSGVAALDIEAVIIENKLPVKPNEGIVYVGPKWGIVFNPVSIDAIRYSALEFGYLECEKGESIQAAFLNYNKIINPPR